MKFPDRYALAVCCTGLILSGVSLFQMDWESHLLPYVFLLVLAVGYRLVRVRLPQGIYVSFTPLYVFVGLSLVGPVPTAGLLALGILLTLGFGTCLRTALFNIGQFLIALYVAGGLYEFLGGQIPPTRLDSATLLQLLAGTVAFLAVNVLLVYASEALYSPERMRRLARNLPWEAVVWALSYSLCVLVLGVREYFQLGLTVTLLLPFPLLALCYLFSRIIDDHMMSLLLSELTDFMTRLSGPLQEDEILDYFFSRLRSVVDYDCCAVWTRTAEGSFAPLQCRPLEPTVTPSSAPEVFQQAANGVPLRGRLGAGLRPWPLQLATVPPRYLLVPMVSGGQVQGLLQLEHRAPRDFTHMDLKLMSRISENLTLALEQSRLVRELRCTKEDLLNILTSSHIAIVVTDEHHRVRIFNSGAGELSGHKEADVRGRPSALFLHPNDYRKVRRLLLRKGKVEDLETEILNAKGQPVPISLSASLLRDGAGRVVGTLAVGYNIAQRKLLQARVVQNEKLAALGRLVTGITHEINNRLQPILGYTQMLHRSPVGEDQHGPLLAIEKSAAEAQTIVQSLLSFWRPGDAQLEPGDLNASIRNVLRMLKIDSGKIALRLLLDPELPATPYDAHQIETVILNLLKNALQALGSHGGTLEIKTEFDAQQVRVVVRDDGPGMSEQLSARVFDPFFTTRAVGQGTGLGLSLCYGILQAHQGSIQLQSRPGRGTEVSFGLPRKASAPAPPAPKERPRPRQQKATGGRIFVVDDEESIRHLLEDILGEDYEVRSLENGKEAIRAMQQDDFDLCICDLRMPEIDGIEIYHWVCDNLAEHAKDFIFITGDTFGPAAQSFLDRAGSRYLCKPFSVAEIEAMVHEHFENRPRSGTPTSQ